MIALISERKTAVRAYCWRIYHTHFVSMWEIETETLCVSLSSVFMLYIELLVFSSTFALIACSILYFCSSRSFLVSSSLIIQLFTNHQSKIRLKSSWLKHGFSTKEIPPFPNTRTATFRQVYCTYICLDWKTKCTSLKPKTRCSFSFHQSSSFESGNVMYFIETSTLTWFNEPGDWALSVEVFVLSLVLE